MLIVAHGEVGINEFVRLSAAVVILISDRFVFVKLTSVFNVLFWN